MNNEDYNEKADIYSFAMILFEMITNAMPFDGLNPVQIIKEVAIKESRPPIPAACHAGFKALITECWQQDPQKRPTAADVLSRLEKCNIKLHLIVKQNGLLNLSLFDW